MRRCDCRAGGPRRRVRLADGCLLVFLAVLLAQSAYSLFSAGSAETEGIDIIVRTSAAGAYSFDNVPAGTYSIAAALDGYIMSPSSLLTLSSGSSIEAPLVCRSEAALALGAIAGTATTIGLAGSAPVAGATVTLRNLAGTAVATTRTADDGEFVFYDVADGIYSLVATADGYLATAPIAVTIAEGSIANVAVNMVVDSRTYNGTVSGIIRDSNGAPVSGPAFFKSGRNLEVQGGK